MVATQHNNNMVAAQNMVQTLLGTDNSKGQEGRDNNTSHKAATTVSKVSMMESLNEEIEVKLSSLNVCCRSFQSLAAGN
jgi:hypothetical protein